MIIIYVLYFLLKAKVLIMQNPFQRSFHIFNFLYYNYYFVREYLGLIWKAPMEQIWYKVMWYVTSLHEIPVSLSNGKKNIQN